jgi:WhiB family redox-sensing transcriptional regulator
MTAAAAVRDWRGLAACRDKDPETFFPQTGHSAAAKLVCAACPVTAECLRLALGTGSRYGVWGGMTEAERRPVPRRRLTRGAA